MAAIQLATLADATGLPSGTSFPGSPANNDKFYRDDRDILYFYDGTRWLSGLYSVQIPAYPQTVHPMSANATGHYASAPWAGTYDLWLEGFQTWFFISGGTALSGSHKWVLSLTKQPAGTGIATITIDSGASSAYRNSGAIAIGALLGTTNFELEVVSTKTGTPGTLFAQPHVIYRLVG